MSWQDTLSKIFKNRVPLSELLPQMLDPGDPRIVIRPLGDDWLCPYTGARIPVANWDGSSLSLLQIPEIVQHLMALPDLERKGAKSVMKSWEDLVYITVMIRLRDARNYKVTSDKGEWVCPHCLSNTGILLHEWDGSPAPLSWFIPEALRHLAICKAYQDDPLGPKSLEELNSLQGEGAIRGDLTRRVASDPIFRIHDDTGAWICPFSERSIASINMYKMQWGSAIQARIVDYLLSPECPARYTKWQTERTLDDLKRLAVRINEERARTQAKQAAEREMSFLKQRIDVLKKDAQHVHEIRKDLQAAKSAQLKMLPDKPPDIPGYEVASHYEPSVELGGDMYHFFDAGPGHTGFMIGDVSGHGVEASLIMSMTLKSFSVRAAGRKSPAAVMAEVNSDLTKDIHRGKFVSAFYTVLEHDSGNLRCARAGHPPGLMVNPTDGSFYALEGQGLVLGVGETAAFVKTLKEYQVYIPPGCVLLLYTDGVTEAMNAEKEEFGEERLHQLVVNYASLSANELLDYIVAGIRDHTGGIQLSDDMTLMAIKRLEIDLSV